MTLEGVEKGEESVERVEGWSAVTSVEGEGVSGRKSDEVIEDGEIGRCAFAFGATEGIEADAFLDDLEAVGEEVRGLEQLGRCGRIFFAMVAGRSAEEGASVGEFGADYITCDGKGGGIVIASSILSTP